jgi:hypothetical protein
VAQQAAVRGWRALDTEANSGRVTRFVAWMRAMSSAGVVARTASPTETAV